MAKPAMKLLRRDLARQHVVEKRKKRQDRHVCSAQNKKSPDATSWAVSQEKGDLVNINFFTKL